ncbi:hypothetical protein EDD86DRAFT_249050 [Gorgonomyces haynaldii]|nr:hypothetical protein EDD86DRAFT_249050 [Gorgonomyces haynaldii]
MLYQVAFLVIFAVMSSRLYGPNFATIYLGLENYVIIILVQIYQIYCLRTSVKSENISLAFEISVNAGLQVFYSTYVLPATNQSFIIAEYFEHGLCYVPGRLTHGNVTYYLLDIDQIKPYRNVLNINETIQALSIPSYQFNNALAFTMSNMYLTALLFLIIAVLTYKLYHYLNIQIYYNYAVFFKYVLFSATYSITFFLCLSLNMLIWFNAIRDFSVLPYELYDSVLQGYNYDYAWIQTLTVISTLLYLILGLSVVRRPRKWALRVFIALVIFMTSYIAFLSGCVCIVSAWMVLRDCYDIASLVSMRRANAVSPETHQQKHKKTRVFQYIVNCCTAYHFLFQLITGIVIIVFRNREYGPGVSRAMMQVIFNLMIVVITIWQFFIMRKRELTQRIAATFEVALNSILVLFLCIFDCKIQTMDKIVVAESLSDKDSAKLLYEHFSQSSCPIPNRLTSNGTFTDNNATFQFVSGLFGLRDSFIDLVTNANGIKTGLSPSVLLIRYAAFSNIFIAVVSVIAMFYTCSKFINHMDMDVYHRFGASIETRRLYYLSILFRAIFDIGIMLSTCIVMLFWSRQIIIWTLPTNALRWDHAQTFVPTWATFVATGATIVFYFMGIHTLKSPTRQAWRIYITFLFMLIGVLCALIYFANTAEEDTIEMLFFRNMCWIGLAYGTLSLIPIFYMYRHGDQIVVMMETKQDDEPLRMLLD